MTLAAYNAVMTLIDRGEENKIILGPTAQKILVLLLGGLTLGLTTSPSQYFRIIKTMRKDWERINRYALHRNIKKLYKARLIDAKDNEDGSTTITLTNKGKKRALTYNIKTIQVTEMKKWDKKWRIVLFDIPEPRKKARDALARTFKNAGFYKFQKSVFVHPFECKNEVDFVIEFFNLRPHVRYVIAEHIDNELHLKQHFGLI